MVRALALIVALLLASPVIAERADAGDRQTDGLDRRFVLGLALGLERFDTNVEITDRETGNSIFLDGEGSFGLPETKSMPILYGAARINEKHGIGFYTFRLDREGTALSVNRNFGRLYVDGSVSFSDRTDFSYLAWQYRLFDDSHTVIKMLVGIYALDLRYEITARGLVSVDGAPVESGEYRDDIDLFAPLPLVGLDYWSRVTDRWYLGGKLAFITGSYSDTDALVIDAALRARYRMTPRVSMVTGVNFLSADVEITRSTTVRDISYGYEGIYLGLDFNF